MCAGDVCPPPLGHSGYAFARELISSSVRRSITLASPSVRTSSAFTIVGSGVSATMASASATTSGVDACASNHAACVPRCTFMQATLPSWRVRRVFATLTVAGPRRARSSSSRWPSSFTCSGSGADSGAGAGSGVTPTPWMFVRCQRRPSAVLNALPFRTQPLCMHARVGDLTVRVDVCVVLPMCMCSCASWAPVRADNVSATW